MNASLSVAAVVVAYLLGSLSFAVIVSRIMGLGDPRTYGSQNPGATNVLRSGSKTAAGFTLLLDMCKGWLPVALVNSWGSAYGLSEGLVAWVGLAAFLGHIYPAFFRFAGGKGVATALGVLLGYSGVLGCLVLIVWLIMAVVFRYASLASLVAAVCAPVMAVLGNGGLWSSNRNTTLSMVVMALFLLYRHVENLNRLFQGTETKIGQSTHPDHEALHPRKRRSRP